MQPNRKFSEIFCWRSFLFVSEEKSSLPILYIYVYFFGESSKVVNAESVSLSTTHSINTKLGENLGPYTAIHIVYHSPSLFYSGYRRRQQHRSTRSFHFCYCQSYRTYPLPLATKCETNPGAFIFFFTFNTLDSASQDEREIKINKKSLPFYFILFFFATATAINARGYHGMISN